MRKNSINWDATPADQAIMVAIADRAMELYESVGVKATKDLRLSTLMDIKACHLNGTRLDLPKLLKFDDFNFGHDVFGIRDHINRKTGKLERMFLPRCAR